MISWWCVLFFTGSKFRNEMIATRYIRWIPWLGHKFSVFNARVIPVLSDKRREYPLNNSQDWVLVDISPVYTFFFCTCFLFGVDWILRYHVLRLSFCSIQRPLFHLYLCCAIVLPCVIINSVPNLLVVFFASLPLSFAFCCVFIPVNASIVKHKKANPYTQIHKKNNKRDAC